MCQCIKDVEGQLKAIFPEATTINLPVELISGRVYVEPAIYTVKKGKTKRETKALTVSFCPFCGQKYPDRGKDDER